MYNLAFPPHFYNIINQHMSEKVSVCVYVCISQIFKNQPRHVIIMRIFKPVSE